MVRSITIQTCLKSNHPSGSSDIKINNPLASVNDWLKQLLDQCDEVPSFIIEGDERFWVEFPILVNALLRRR